MPGAKNDGRTLLAVFAHPDDETFATGGTLSRYAAEGVRVVEVCATRGEKGQTGDPPLVDQAGLGAWREKELHCAAQAIGIEELTFLGCIDGELSQCGRERVLADIVRAVRRYRPQVVLSFGSDGTSAHPDHKAISALATDAFLAAPDEKRFPEQLQDGLAPWSPSKLYYTAVRRSLAEARGFPLAGVHDWLVSTVVDISRYVDRKRRAFQCHRTQAKDYARFVRLNDGLIPTTEAFRLAISRVGPIDVQENDLFAGIS
ncbi:MAG: PIG-L family deacetylase [Bacteroidetes bacterium]|nr:PIG-L family deacetylase [Bacteroidota bacterium]MCL5027376.1 PIG-L family deacetylase [Chloroflexota bacterium]